MGGFIKTYTNLKLKQSVYQNPETGAVGPQNLTASALYYTSCVPCRGAAQVVFRFRGTDTNNAGSFTANVSNGAAALASLAAGSASGVTLVNPGANTIREGGVSVVVRPTLGNVMGHDFAQGGITAGGSGHTGVVVDADVYYASDADATLAAHGQSGLTVPA